jgi:hypothetical protein
LGHNTARSDILAADQPQPVEPLLVGQGDIRPFVHAAPHAYPVTIAQPGLCGNRLCGFADEVPRAGAGLE